MCQKINIECHNNLMVCSALCSGLYAITEVKITEASPFHSLIGPDVPVSAGDIDAGFPKFYEHIFEEDGDFIKAQQELSDKFKLFLSERLFVNSFRDYISSQCKGDGQIERVNKLLKEVLANHPGKEIYENEFRNMLMDLTSPNINSFNKFKRAFLMSDHPLNQGRFDNISWDLMQSAISRSKVKE
jgi:hypothetical protein